MAALAVSAGRWRSTVNLHRAQATFPGPARPWSQVINTRPGNWMLIEGTIDQRRKKRRSAI